MKDIEIKKVDTISECIDCNKMLERLIKFEATLSPTIKADKKIEHFYENTLNKEDCVIFIAKNLNTPIGYIMAYISNQSQSNYGNIVIMNLYIENAFRGKSIGKLLIESVEGWATNKLKNCTINLKCIKQNDVAIGFYKKLGFKQIEEKNNLIFFKKEI